MTVDEEVLADLGALSNRPYDFVMWAFPWGEEDTELEEQDGPDTWQITCLKELQESLLNGGDILDLFTIRSGHGVGKSALFSWLILWAMATRANTRGRVTANTKEQLMRVLWGELSKWHGLFIAKHLFKVTATAIFAIQEEKRWRIDAIPWSEDNPEAFAGLHNFGGRLLYLFDEGSAIPASIWEVMQGATTDIKTQIIWGVAGNPTRNSGSFRDSHNEGSEWRKYCVDARESKLGNQELFAKWEKTYGEDSDFFRVRVRGEFPNAATTQLIPIELIKQAGVRPVQSHFQEPLVLGVDIARFGSNASVAQFRRGRDARSLPAHSWRGLDVVQVANRVAGLISERHPDAVFIDEGGVGGGVVDVLRSLGHAVIPVNFGVPASTRPGGTLVANKRAEMFVTLREWLREGGCIDPSEDLSKELISIEYHFNKKQEIQLMSKEDMRSIGRESPDWGDALALTFAYPVALQTWRQTNNSMKVEYDPFSHDAFIGAQ
jgi:hypothetical protein